MRSVLRSASRSYAFSRERRIRPRTANDSPRLTPRERALWQALSVVRVPRARLEPEPEGGRIVLLCDGRRVGRWAVVEGGFAYTREGAAVPTMLAESTLEAVECTLELIIASETEK